MKKNLVINNTKLKRNQTNEKQKNNYVMKNDRKKHMCKIIKNEI